MSSEALDTFNKGINDKRVAEEENSPSEALNENKIGAYRMLCMLPVLAGAAFCHPFLVISSNVIYARFYPTDTAR